ncbi:hypothetical protein ALT721_600047 [Alteromonas alvinellae]
MIVNLCWIGKKSFTIFVITDKKRAVIPRFNYIHATAAW